MSKCLVCDEPVEVRCLGKNVQCFVTYTTANLMTLAGYGEHVRHAHTEQSKRKEPEFSED